MAFNPNEPRDKFGRWTSFGGALSGGDARRRPRPIRPQDRRVRRETRPFRAFGVNGEVRYLGEHGFWEIRRGGGRGWRTQNPYGLPPLKGFGGRHAIGADGDLAIFPDLDEAESGWIDYLAYNGNRLTVRQFLKNHFAKLGIEGEHQLAELSDKLKDKLEKPILGMGAEARTHLVKFLEDLHHMAEGFIEHGPVTHDTPLPDPHAAHGHFQHGGAGTTGPDRPANSPKSYVPNIQYHTVIFGKHGPDPQKVTYAQLTNPIIDGSTINAHHHTRVDFSFTIDQEGGIVLTPYVPWAPGMSGKSGVSFGAGCDLGQQTRQTWSRIAAGDRRLFEAFSGAVGSDIQRQEALNWLKKKSPAALSVQQAETVTQNVFSIYIKYTLDFYNINVTQRHGSFSDLSENRQTVFFDRMFNASSAINPKFYAYVFAGDWDGAANYLRSEANTRAGSPLGARLGAEARLLGR